MPTIASLVIALDSDSLRNVVALAGNTRGADRWSAFQWLRLYVAYSESGWDLTPCRWSERQIREALRAKNALVPQFNDDESPRYPGKSLGRCDAGAWSRRIVTG